MRKTILLCFFAIMTTMVQSQITIQVSDVETNENIEFASILLPEHEKSFVADENGKFLIDTNRYKLPLRVIVEQFGFDPQEITLQSTTQLFKVSLSPEPELLREIIIPPKNSKIKERIFGRTSEGSGKIVGTFKNYHTENSYSGLEFGLILNTNNKFKKVKKIHWHINTLTLEKAIYNLQFYEVENGKPTDKISHPEINFTITDKDKGWVVIEVDDFDIYIDGTKKIAAILKTQKVELKSGTDGGTLALNLGIPAVSNLIVGRDSYYEEWSKIPVNYPFYITVDSYE